MLTVLKWFGLPLVLAGGLLVVVWLAYQEGKANRAGCADAIAACEERRFDDHAKLMADRESLLAQREATLGEAQKQMEKLKHDKVQLQNELARLDASFGSASAELASIRLRDFLAAGGDPVLPGDPGAGDVAVGAAGERTACPRAFVESCAQDALKVLRLQEAYETVRGMQ
jgi:hypothetical protein